jgi:hypothetical protein
MVCRQVQDSHDHIFNSELFSAPVIANFQNCTLRTKMINLFHNTIAVLKEYDDKMR